MYNIKIYMILIKYLLYTLNQATSVLKNIMPVTLYTRLLFSEL